MQTSDTTRFAIYRICCSIVGHFWKQMFLVKLLGMYLATGLALLVAILLLRRKQRRFLDRFMRRAPQNTEDFLNDCSIMSSSDRSRIAIAIRESLADLGTVPSALIRSTDRFDRDLEWLKFGQRFEVYEFADLLEKKCGLRLRGKQLEIPNPDVPPAGLTVRDFVKRILTAATPHKE